ncbi:MULTISPECIES: hypothetical protein [unclassified Oceanispirochaeta]|uniref:hypothetical protein n=1 Tax=unclassified Oceanispirochaeta TaxID=2635722 RepID=UPI000E08FC5F|nr:MULTISPECIES: hypothetical protein [unclassified Oceanispirochaeta]MBF9018807.1 hypothetical protein [Oceanispirochaeta sp. M2]NPD75276.1 hypothetical protein [Oceanispirochaeta sp. M1]RDG28867.1 hypothetical protein DV872_24595 [Oceanispirochaeta sp. M1]
MKIFKLTLITFFLFTLLCHGNSVTENNGTVRVGVTDCDYSSLRSALENTSENVSCIMLEEGAFIESGLVVDRDLIIIGEGRNKTFIRGDAESGKAGDRVFTIAEGAEVRLIALTIENGVAHGDLRRGGGILNLGTLRMEDCLVRNNAAVYGAGLDNRGRAIISDSAFTGNFTIPMNMAERTSGSGCLGSGGAIKNEPGGILHMIDCLIEENSAMVRGGALFVSCESRAVLNTCTIKNNKADRGGGAVYIRGDLTLINNHITKNTTRIGAGGVHVTGFLNFSKNVIRENSLSDLTVESSILLDGSDRIGIDKKNRIEIRNVMD